MSNSQRRNLIAAALLLIIIFAVIFWFMYLNQKSERNYYKLTSNVQNYWLDKGSMYYYTGSFFAKYNLNDNIVTQLSDYTFISSDIDSVNWRGGSVVFQTNPNDADIDDVTTIAKGYGIKPHTSHWWKYDFELKQYQLLDFADIDSCTSLIQLNSNRLSCLQPGDSGAYSAVVKVFDLTTKKSKTLLSTDTAVSSQYSLNNRLYYIRTTLGGTQSLRFIDLDTQKDTLVYKSAEDIKSFMVNKDGVVLNEVNKNSNKSSNEGGSQINLSQKIIVLDENNKELVDKSIDSSPVSLYTDSQGNILFSSLDGSISKVSGKVITQLFKPTDTALKNGDLLFTNNENAYLLAQDGTLSSARKVKKEKGYRAESSFNISTDNDPLGRFYIDQSQSGNRGVYLFTKNTSSVEQQRTVGEYLADKGFRPSEFSLTWTLGDPSITISPSAALVR